VYLRSTLRQTQTSDNKQRPFIELGNYPQIKRAYPLSNFHHHTKKELRTMARMLIPHPKASSTNMFSATTNKHKRKSTVGNKEIYNNDPFCAGAVPLFKTNAKEGIKNNKREN
jgi:hypothetical protein